MQYAYRESVLKWAGQYFAIDMLLDLTPRSTPYEAYNPTELQQIRREKQPPGLSCGSFFTKWYRVGWVQISEHHGNFFLNNEKWTWSDVLALRDSVKKIVLEKHGIELHEEVRIISDSH
jgi:UDP-N-acetylenolpyruvoylglucosamine reductase